MKASKLKFKTVDEYLSALPPKTTGIVNKLRNTIKKAAPESEEIISYQMPAYKFHGILVWFSVHKEHIGFYPMADAIKVFKKELAEYEQSKGTIKFPLNIPLPLNLISKIVKYRMQENLEKANMKSKK